LRTDEDAPVATKEEQTTARLVQRKKKQPKGKRDKSERMQKTRGKNIQKKTSKRRSHINETGRVSGSPLG
jgi:hypothetical protein